MTATREALWAEQGEAWRDPTQVVSNWPDASQHVDRRLLSSRAHGAFWEELERLQVTVLLGREYEHLLLALSAVDGVPRVSYLALPHPGGIAVAPGGDAVFVAATRNPNQVYELRPVTGQIERADVPGLAPPDRPLVPVASRFLPGCLYLHDLAFVGGVLHGNATGMNAVTRLDGDDQLAWWPRAVEDSEGRPRTDRNLIQLNSIAAGASLETSFFTASTAVAGTRRPGQRHFAVDGRGVLFSGATREVAARGLTRPHSARLRDGAVWVADSGYGRLCRIADGTVETVTTLPGWTRGLALVDDVSIVATSRVLPRFAAYAPGLDVDRSRCGLHVVDTATGTVRGSLEWPWGNQIFAVEVLPAARSLGFPFVAGRPAPARARSLFYSYRTNPTD